MAVRTVASSKEGIEITFESRVTISERRTCESCSVQRFSFISSRLTIQHALVVNPRQCQENGPRRTLKSDIEADN